MSYLILKYNSNKGYSLGYSIKDIAPEEKEVLPLFKEGDFQDVILEINKQGGTLRNDFYGGVEVIVLGEPPLKEKNAIIANVERLNLSSRFVKYAMCLEGNRF